MPPMIDVQPAVGKYAVANAPTAGAQPGLLPGFTTVTVFCAHCHTEGLAHGLDVGGARWHLIKQGWHSRGHGAWVCPRCCAGARRAARPRRRW